LEFYFHILTAVLFGNSTSYEAAHNEMLQTTATASLLLSNVLVSIMFTRFAGRRKTDIEL